MSMFSWMFIHPYLPVRGSFFLPDWRNAFQLINTPLACLKGIRPVGSANHNQDDVFANAYLADPVDYIDLYYVKIFKRLLPDLIQFIFCHPGIVLKVKFADRPSAGCASSCAEEYYNTSNITGNCLDPVNLFIY